MQKYTFEQPSEKNRLDSTREMEYRATAMTAMDVKLYSVLVLLIRLKRMHFLLLIQQSTRARISISLFMQQMTRVVFGLIDSIFPEILLQFQRRHFSIWRFTSDNREVPQILP